MPIMLDRSVKLHPLRAPESAPLRPPFAHRLPPSDRCLLCPAGQFLWRRTWFELDRKRSSVHVVSASRHPKQYGLQPHRSLNRHRAGGWTEHAALFTFSFPSNCTKQQPPWSYFYTVKTIMGFLPDTHFHVRPQDTVSSVTVAGAATPGNNSGSRLHQK